MNVVETMMKMMITRTRKGKRQSIWPMRRIALNNFVLGNRTTLKRMHKKRFNIKGMIFRNNLLKCFF